MRAWSGTYQINDYDSDDYILIECLKLGHISISGQVGGSHSEEFLRYKFLTDQTVLGELISRWRKMLLM